MQVCRRRHIEIDVTGGGMLGMHGTDLLLYQLSLLVLLASCTVHLVDLLDDTEEHILDTLTCACRYLIEWHFVAKENGVELAPVKFSTE